jgi:hypothetical protein
MDVADQLRLRQREQVVVAAKLARPRAKALAPKILFGQARALDHRPHGAIEHQDAAGKQLGKLAGFRCRHGHPEKEKARSAFAGNGPLVLRSGTRLFSGICYAPAS